MSFRLQERPSVSFFIRQQFQPFPRLQIVIIGQYRLQLIHFIAQGGSFFEVQILFFFTEGYPAIIASFVISTLAHFAIGAAKTVVTGLSPWKSGGEMTVVGLGEAIITYLLGLAFGPLVH